MSQKHSVQHEVALAPAASPLRWILALVVLLSSAAMFAMLLAKSNETDKRVTDSALKTKPTVDQSMPTDPAAFGPTIANNITPTGTAPQGMAWIPGGQFSMGSNMDSESLMA